jgi:hypothetical protein
MSGSKIDFFISYSSVDEAWAKWVAWILEEKGIPTTLQAWDFAAGSNFVLEMQRAASESSRTIGILSPDYLESKFAAPEWAAAFANDPKGLKRSLVLVRVRECEAPGLLKAIVHIDLVGREEDEARERLLDGVTGRRGKPSKKPQYPGKQSTQTKAHPPFPGPGLSASGAKAPPRHMPKIRRAPTDLEKRRFIQTAFDSTARHFESALAELSAQDSAVEHEFNAVTATKLVAEIFLSGKSQARCKIWIGDRLGGEGIAYFDGGFVFDNDDNTTNELLSLADDELALRPLMGSMGGHEAEGLNLEHLTAEDAAEYLWRRFTSRLD